MKVSYSKVLVHGVIATTLLMAMSCQKKGSPRGVQPQTATQADKPETDVKAAEPKLDNIPGAKDPTVVTGKDENKDSAPKKETPEIANKTSEDPTTVAPPVVVTEKKSDTTEAVKTKVDSAPKACPESIVKATNAMTALYKKISDEEKVSTTPEADKIADYNAYLKLCSAWPTLFTTEKIESCGRYSYVEGIGVNLSRNAKSSETGCVKIALASTELTGKSNTLSLAAAKIQAEKMKSLRLEKMVVSTEAKEMFNKENIGWKMFIVDGNLQTDSALLTEALKADKVACTIKGASLDKYTTGQNVILSFSAVSELVSNDEADQVKKGVEFAVRIKASATDATVEEAAKVADEKLVMNCSNLDHKNLSTSLLKKALGQLIAVAKATETKVESKVEPKK